MGKHIGPTPDRAERTTLISMLARNQARRHWVYSGHYPGTFVAPKNAQNSETKRWSGAVPILLLAFLASTTSAYTSLGVLQELNPQPQLHKRWSNHSATSAVGKTCSFCKRGVPICKFLGPNPRVQTGSPGCKRGVPVCIRGCLF